MNQQQQQQHHCQSPQSPADITTQHTSGQSNVTQGRITATTTTTNTCMAERD